MKYTLKLRQEVIAAHLQGYSTDEILVVFPNINKALYKRWVKEVTERGTITPKKSTGRPSKYSGRDKRAVWRAATNHPFITIKQIQDTQRKRHSVR
ncbi:hypothetical protein BC833DRAFT_586463 [Globomyces pollinis-pini]|nr:hypothetical protein BC833DRAFT_586463 [Globomyces pollinis-pini]